MGAIKVTATTSVSTKMRSAFYVDSSSLEMMTLDHDRSTDNGGHFERSPTDYSKIVNRNPPSLWRHYFNGFVDPVNNHLIVLFNSGDFIKKPEDDEPPEALTLGYLRYMVSVDKGHSFLFNERITQPDPIDCTQPFDQVRLGSNGFTLGDEPCRPIRTQKGHILVPAQMTVFSETGKPEDFGNEVTKRNMGYFHALILIGTWQKDFRLKWQAVEIVADRKASSRGPDEGNPSSRGMFEPTLVELPSGKLLCVMRGSNGYKKDGKAEQPSRKWYSLSQDGGFTWTEPLPWGYSPEEPFFSPSSTSQLIKHSNGRIYWIGNLTPTNCTLNEPRWPLVIGEVDPVSAMLIKETVTVIDNTPPEIINPGQNQIFQELSLSNFQAYEDRATHEIFLLANLVRKPPVGSQNERTPMLYRIDVSS